MLGPGAFSRIGTTWLSLLALLMLLGCGGEAAGPAPSPGASSPPATGERIIAIAPSSVEILYVLGLGEQVVGVGDWVRHPPQVETLPRLGGLFDPNLEEIVTLAPDLAVLLVSEEAQIGAQLRRLGVETLVIDSDSLADMDAAVRTVAQRCGVPERGEAFLATWKEALAPRPRQGAPPRVFLSLSREAGHLAEILSVGPGSYADELLTRLGAENVLADASIPFPQVGLEAVIARAPEVVIELYSGHPSPPQVRALTEDWARYPQLPAVASGRVSVISGTHTMIPGPRLPQLYRELEAAIFGPSAEAEGER